VGRVVATLIRMTGDWDPAEECVREALAPALATRRRPAPPRRLADGDLAQPRLDRLRRPDTEAATLKEVATLSSLDEPDDGSVVRDDRLRLIFTCRQPALPPEAPAPALVAPVREPAPGVRRGRSPARSAFRRRGVRPSR
jgi:RNA polymerase sigma-70 factor (ECF subfamily)